MKRLLFIIFLFINGQNLLFAQNDTIPKLNPAKNDSFLKRSAVPLTMIGTGLVINYASGSIGKENIQENIQNSLDNFHTNAENYLMFVPTISMYTADLLKVKSKNDAFTQTKYLAIAGIANNLITFSLKHLTDEERPNGESYSFPSGHTSNAFVMATVLHHEFIDSSPILAYSGFIFATTTGVLRVLNNKHWVSDVLVGAGIGILVTDLVYRLEPLKNWNPFKDKKCHSLIISPTYQNNQFGLYANLQF
ncbi:MAG: hypothetical protein DSY82_01330 [Flavobacteriia bacterium]|nr:MAG: hypothetical protein DSY82_01330 [Flavobacteriia bacterium]